MQEAIVVAEAEGQGCAGQVNRVVQVSCPLWIPTLQELKEREHRAIGRGAEHRLVKRAKATEAVDVSLQLAGAAALAEPQRVPAMTAKKARGSNLSQQVFMGDDQAAPNPLSAELPGRPFDVHHVSGGTNYDSEVHRFANVTLVIMRLSFSRFNIRWFSVSECRD
jgi:hypothetical protein